MAGNHEIKVVNIIFFDDRGSSKFELFDWVLFLVQIDQFKRLVDGPYGFFFVTFALFVSIPTLVVVLFRILVATLEFVIVVFEFLFIG